MRKLLSLLTFLWVFTVCAPAQQAVYNIGLIGTLVDPTGTPITGHMTLALTMANVQNTCTTPYMNAPRGQITFTVTNGTIVGGSTANLLVQDCMKPRAAYYVSVYDSNNKLLFADNWYFHSVAINNSVRAQDVGALVSTNFTGPIAVALSQAVVTAPTGNQTITQPAGTNLIINSAICTGTCTGFGGSGGSGSLTSVGIQMPASVFNVTTSPITSSGNLVVGFATQTPGTVLAGPCGGTTAATPAFRVLCSSDIPNNAANTTGLSGGITSVLPIANGGTGQSTAPSLLGGGGITISGTWPNQTVTGSSIATGSATQLAIFQAGNKIAGDPNITDSGTQVTVSVPLYLPNLTASACLALNASNIVVTQACGGGTSGGTAPYLGSFNTSQGPQMNFGGTGGYLELNGSGTITGITPNAACLGVGAVACTYSILSENGFYMAYSSTGGPTNNLNVSPPSLYIVGGTVVNVTYDPLNGLWHANPDQVSALTLYGTIPATNIATSSLANTTVLYNNYYQGAYSGTTPYTEGEMVSSAGQVFTSLIGANTGNTPQSSPADWAALGLSCSQALCPSTYGNANFGTAETSTATSIALQTGYGGITTGYGCFWVDTEYECYQYMSGGVLYGLTRGAYGTTAAAHANGAQIYPTNVVGNVGNTPGLIVSYGWAANPLVAVNNPFPNYHANNSVFSVNSGGNEVFISPTGQIYQENPSAVNYFYGNIQVSSAPNVPVIASSGNLLQNNGPNTAYQPIGFGGGVAGSLNVINTPTLGPPIIADYSTGGTSTRTYVCSGVDFDGNLIPGTPASDTHASATVPAPNFISIVCPYAAGIAGYQVWRTVGGPSQGLLSAANGDEGLQVFDSDSATTGGSPPSSNGSSPHISVAGTTHTVCDTSVSPNVCMIFAAGAPSGCGTTYGQGSIYSNESGGATPVSVCTSTGWVGITLP